MSGRNDGRSKPRVSRVLVVFVVVAAGMAGASARAIAAVESPGLLRAADVPHSLHQVGVVQTFPNLDSTVIDGATCTLRSQPLAGARSVVGVDFGPANAPAESAFLTERVVSFS